MKKTSKFLVLIIVMFMLMQVVLPTISQAVENVKLNIQFERPFNDDNGDGTVGNDIYKLVREALQTVFKIGEQTETNENLNFDTEYAYYCLRGSLGFGSTETILEDGLEYKYIMDLSDSESVIEFFNTIGYTDEEPVNYNAIKWIADNMYLPKSEFATELKANLINNAGIENSQLTDDDIEVVQQVALWYFTNYDENGEANSVSLPDDANLGMQILQIQGQNYSNDENMAFNLTRAQQITELYEYFIDGATNATNEVKTVEEIELDENLEPTIEQKTLSKLETYVVGPFKINKTQEGNIDYTFTYSLKYKINSDQDWQELQLDNTTVYLSDIDGNKLDRTQNLEEMIGGESFYIALLKDVLNISKITDFRLDIKCDTIYYNTTATVWEATIENQQPVLKVEKEKVALSGEDYIEVQKTEEPVKEFDLALRKFITGTNGQEVADRIPEIYLAELRTEDTSTATYEHTKEPILLKRGDYIIYTIRVYNEGDLDGYAKEITDYLCDELDFVTDSEINKEYGWTLSEDGKTLKTNYLKDTLIKAYDPDMTEELLDRDNLWQKSEDGDDGLYYADLLVECKIKDTAQDFALLPNIAAITEDLANDETDTHDRDSDPTDLNESELRDYTDNPWIEDDDDYEMVKVEPDKVFDLALRKYIDYIERKGESVEFESRLPQVDTKPLTEGKTTANYIHQKNTLTVKQGDIITYKLRVYNEGDLDGFVTEITDYIPEGLGLLFGHTKNDSWSFSGEEVISKPLVGEDGIYETIEDVPVNGIFANEDLDNIEIITGKEGTLKIVDNTSLDDKLIKHFGGVAEEGDLYQESKNSEDNGLFYQEIEVTCIVLAPNTYEGTITNIAEISEDKAIDEFGTEVNIPDRDSNPANVMEDGNHTPGSEENGYTPGEQDDDDFEPVQLKYFDLALKKFITGVNEEVVDTRIPEFYIDENGEYKYKHDKTPVEVTNNDDVTYTIRVFNEGSLDGYAEEIEDDIPEGLIFLPENETNKEYGWKMYYYDEKGVLTETDDVEKATVIRTTYLSEANGTINEETGKNSNLLERFNKEIIKSPYYKDIKVVFKVSQADIPTENEDRIIVNKAHITDDSDDDEDSIPDKWNEGEDDQDKEYIYVQEFDLALYKWVSKTIVTVDGKTTETETGFKPNVGKTEGSGDKYRTNSEQEPIASVTLDKKKLKSTEVKFVYNIKVVNEGDISGYATEITDYIPEGLKFVPEDNPLWTLGEDGKITTRALETTILDPGMSATIPVTFTWINDANNLGVKTNIAAITEDYNEKDVDDVDSIPGNEDIPNYDTEIEKEQEDDDDFALVILQLKTGKNITYIGLILLCITIILAGAITIKKYVL